jgi:hypothetical protein
MAKEQGAGRKATTRGAEPAKLGINTFEATVAMEDLLRRLKETKARKDTGWNLLERKQVKLVEVLLTSTLKKMSCPPNQSIPRPKKLLTRKR